MPVTVVQPGFVIGRPKRGSEATKRGEGVGGGIPPPTVYREIFANSCMQTAFSRTLKAIIRGSLCRGIDHFPPLFLFLLNLSQTFFFFFLSFLSVFLFFFFSRFLLCPFSPPFFSLFPLPFLLFLVTGPSGGGALCPPCPPPLGTLLEGAGGRGDKHNKREREVSERELCAWYIHSNTIFTIKLRNCALFIFYIHWIIHRWPVKETLIFKPPLPPPPS